MADISPSVLMVLCTFNPIGNHLRLICSYGRLSNYEKNATTFPNCFLYNNHGGILIYMQVPAVYVRQLQYFKEAIKNSKSPNIPCAK